MGETKGIFKCGKKTSKTQILVLEIYSTNGLMVQTTSIHVDIVKSLATPAQIETCLKAYAVKNGYVDGARVKGMSNSIIWVSTSNYEYHASMDILSVNGITIYEKGKWAEIVQHAPSVQDKQDEELAESINNFVGFSQKVNGSETYIIRGVNVSIHELIDTYTKMLDIKTIIG